MAPQAPTIPQATEIFHEGIRLPALKLVERGGSRDDLWQLLMLNTRTPDLLDGDLRAMLGSTRIGAEQVAKLVDDLGDRRAACHAISKASSTMPTAACARRSRALPDGIYRGEEQFDNDCFEPMDIPHPGRADQARRRA